jgi:hypothetical protein
VLLGDALGLGGLARPLLRGGVRVIGAAQVRLGLLAFALGLDLRRAGGAAADLGLLFGVARGGAPRAGLDLPLDAAGACPAAPDGDGREEQQEHDDDGDDDHEGGVHAIRGTRRRMNRPDADTVLRWRGREVHDAHGEKLGSLGALYLDPDGGDVPLWGGVRTGLLGRKESIVPLHGAEEVEDGVRLAVSADRVRSAPSVDPDAELTLEEEDLLRSHYQPPAATEPGEMVRHEEEVTAGVEEMAPRERVRLRKVLVTEDVTQEVPVRKEVVQLETDPPPEGTIEAVEEAEPGARPGEREL